MRRPPTRRAARRAGIVAGAAVLAVVGCQDDDPQSETSTTTAAAPTTGDGGDGGDGGDDRAGATVGTVTPASTAPAPTESAPATTTAGPAGPDCDALPLDRAADLSLGELLASSPELSRFAEAWETAGLGDRLINDEPVTLIAPTDLAFEALDPRTAERLTADPAGALARVLELHLLDGDHTLAELLRAGTVAGPNGTLTATDVDTAVLLDTGGGPAVVTCRDVVAANGRLHVVDGVLLPPPADTEAVGGSRLYRVDPDTGAATPAGAFGDELGVLDVVALDDTTLLALTDSAELITFPAATPNEATDRTPISGVEGATLLALDHTADGSLLGVTDLSRLYRIDPTTGTATPLGPAVEPAVADLGVAIDTGPDGLVRLVVATGADVTIDPATGDVVATGVRPTFAEGDPNAGADARIVALASLGDQHVAVDATTGSLVRLDEAGALTTIGPLGATLTDGAGLDTTPSGELFLTIPG